MNKTSQDTTHPNLLLALSSAIAEYEYPAKDKNTTRKSCVFIADMIFSGTWRNYHKYYGNNNVLERNLN